MSGHIWNKISYEHKNVRLDIFDKFLATSGGSWLHGIMFCSREPNAHSAPLWMGEGGGGRNGRGFSRFDKKVCRPLGHNSDTDCFSMDL